jgi:glycosyltransferase involved in cell wall biosynthesis
MSPIQARLGLQQRVLPSYRLPFFNALGAACPNGLSLFAGQARPSEAIEPGLALQNAQLTLSHNLHLFSGPLYLCWQPRLLAWLEAWQPEALILEANPRYLGTGSAVRWMHARSRPVIGWGLGAPPGRGLLAGLRSRSRRQFVRQFDAMITYSRRGASEYQSAGFSPERIFIAPNAVALTPASPPAARPSEYAGGRPTVLFVGRLQARKRLDFLLRACAALPEAQQPELQVVGDGPARAGLQALAAQIYPRAQFPGFRQGAELGEFYSSADLFVLPGTGGLAVQQAMSHGLPVLVAEADGTQSDLVRPENGWCLPPGDLPALTAALQSALADINRLRQMGQASYRIVSQEINVENMVQVFTQAVLAVTVG